MSHQYRQPQSRSRSQSQQGYHNYSNAASKPSAARMSSAEFGYNNTYTRARNASQTGGYENRNSTIGRPAPTGSSNNFHYKNKPVNQQSGRLSIASRNALGLDEFGGGGKIYEDEDEDRDSVPIGSATNFDGFEPNRPHQQQFSATGSTFRERQQQLQQQQRQEQEYYRQGFGVVGYDQQRLANQQVS